jgi:hypothetical protein
MFVRACGMDAKRGELVARLLLTGVCSRDVDMMMGMVEMACGWAVQRCRIA